MKTCKIVFPRVLQTEERPDNISSPEQAKVKITSALLTAVEYAAYRGDEDLKYPLVPGRFAVGIVVEAGENCCAVEKGTRVYLNGVYACGQDAEEKLCVAGADCDGFLRDFIVTDEEKLSPLPAAVSDKEVCLPKPLRCARRWRIRSRRTRGGTSPSSARPRSA